MRAAAAGRRVLVTSTDPAHSLADVIDQPLGDAPTPVTGRSWSGLLHAQQIDAQARLERHWRDVRDYLVAVLARGGVGSVQAEELVLLPGLDELFALIDLNEHATSDAYDLVVVDCAPTAETLRLLGLPDALRWYADRVLGPGRRVARAVRPIARGLGGPESVTIPDDDVFAAVERVHRELAEVHDLLLDAGRSTVRLVVSPERVVIAESQRTATSLSLFGHALDAVVVNRLLPDAVHDPYLAGWRQRQRQHLDTVRAAFAPTPVLTAPLLSDEPVGTEPLSRLGEAIYADHDESAVLYATRPVVLEADGRDHLLRVALPFADERDLDLHRRGAELHLKVAGVKRTVQLPLALRRYDVATARLADGWLEVRFRPVAEEAVAP